MSAKPPPEVHLEIATAKGNVDSAYEARLSSFAGVHTRLKELDSLVDGSETEVLGAAPNGAKGRLSESAR